MKKTLLSLLITGTTLTAGAQAVFEHTYTPVGNAQLVRLEDEGDKYLMWDTASKTNKLYNLDHSLWKEINYTMPAGWNGGAASLASTKLFNLDKKVEVAVFFSRYDAVANKYYFSTHVINEDGVLINKFDDVLGIYPHKTSSGWKLIVNGWGDAKTHIYSLPGSMPQPSGFKPEPRTSGETSISPNPVDISATLTYSLPSGTTQAPLFVYNSSGQLVRQLIVTNQTTHIILHRDGLPAGTYVYVVAGQQNTFIIR